MVFNKLNCAITGHTGVLGKQLVKKKLGLKFIKFQGDITKKKEVKNWIKLNKIDIVIHLAAKVPTKFVNKNYKYANKVNYLGTKNLIDSILETKKKVKWFFFASTSHVYKFSVKKISENHLKKPITKYGLTKLKAENYVKKKLSKHNIKYCIGRIFSFTHSTQKNLYVVPNIINKVKKNKNIIIFNNMNHYRDFVSINDICEAIKFLLYKRSVGIFNIASGKKILISAIAKIICKKLKKKAVFNNNKKQTSLVANINKIKKINWKPKKNIYQIIKELL